MGLEELDSGWADGMQIRDLVELAPNSTEQTCNKTEKVPNRHTVDRDSNNADKDVPLLQECALSCPCGGTISGS
jgi:hypothetical protein